MEEDKNTSCLKLISKNEINQEAGAFIMLFHYHFWTPYVEGTEKFYKENGFRISLRIGRYKGDFQNFNPPLTWDDFRDKDITFRIIEARYGAVNITFGYGKKVMFDHIGFLVTAAELDEICQSAEDMNWKTSRGERRSFIGTPYGFRIELQVNADAIDGPPDIAELEAIEMSVKSEGLDQDLTRLFSKPVTPIRSAIGNTVTINKATIKGLSLSNQIDPNGVQLIGSV